jgi:hypothetical protein
MKQNLETKIEGTYSFKSEGERKIAEVLNRYRIDFRYEWPVLVRDYDQKFRIWYPDFFLPKYGVYLEYFGYENNPDYDNGRKRKEKIYKEMKMDVISIDSKILENQLENHIINQLYRIQTKRQTEVKSKIYTLRTPLGKKYPQV